MGMTPRVEAACGAVTQAKAQAKAQVKRCARGLGGLTSPREGEEQLRLDFHITYTAPDRKCGRSRCMGLVLVNTETRILITPI